MCPPISDGTILEAYTDTSTITVNVATGGIETLAFISTTSWRPFITSEPTWRTRTRRLLPRTEKPRTLSSETLRSSVRRRMGEQEGRHKGVTTAYHSQYWAHALTLRGATGTIEALSRSIAGARVDLNPHQVDAALFAIRSPLTKGVILADEVGLGKTMEAGIVIAQRWAEGKRRLLVTG